MNDQNLNELRIPTLAKIALFAALSAACTQNVDPVGDGTGGDGGTGPGTSSATTGGSNAGGADGGSNQGGNGEGGAQFGGGNAIALLQSELPRGGSGGGSSVATGPEPDPNTLHIDVSDIVVECAEPYGLDCGGHWKVSFSLPVELQHPGVYPLEQVNGFFLIAGDEDPENCSGGGGSWWEGQVEILEIDDQHVSGVFTGTDTFDFDANISFNAIRCF